MSRGSNLRWLYECSQQQKVRTVPVKYGNKIILPDGTICGSMWEAGVYQYQKGEVSVYRLLWAWFWRLLAVFFLLSGVAVKLRGLWFTPPYIWILYWAYRLYSIAWKKKTAS